MTTAGELRVGIDIGGTFTDLTLADRARGTLQHSKVPSTPQNPSDAMIEGLLQVTAAAGGSPADVGYLVHGTTLALNTLLQRQGAHVALIVCRANRHVLDLARLRVSEQFSFTPKAPKSLVAPERVLPIKGRLLADGREYEALDPEELSAIPAWLEAVGAQSCAVALLNSYHDPRHEQEVASVVRSAFPSLPLSLSSEIWPEIREYERTMVTVMNAYVAPQMTSYFSRLSDQLKELDVRTVPLITRSNGGLMTIDEAAERPIETLLSGPASGVVGARYAALSAGRDDCITFDMGGTSADVSVVVGGKPLSSSGAHVGEFPVIIPSVEVSAIGAGGGSIAWRDSSGILKVGPRSAGSDPGPVCYGRGGEAPTVTDAYLLCGFLNPTSFAGGTLKLSPELAEEAMGRLGETIGLGPRETAVAILRIATATMAARVGPLMASLGIDAREFTLLPYGGAGPVHACLLAGEVGINEILVPASPGTLCATGALINDMSRDWVRTFRHSLDQDVLDDAQREFAELDRAATRWLEQQPVRMESSDVTSSVDMRYSGQAYEIEVALGAEGMRADLAPVLDAFHRQHEKIHGHSDSEAPVEIVNLRVRAVGRTEKFETRSVDGRRGQTATTCPVRKMWFVEGAVDGFVYQRSALGAGTAITGPAIVEQEDTTVVIPPGFLGAVDPFGNLLIRREGVENADA